MTADLFVDTSGWAAWLDVREQHHALAVRLLTDAAVRRRRLVTTNWVLVELSALLTSPLRFSKPRQVALMDDIRSNPAVVLLSVEGTLEADAWRLWRSRADKEWSLVDCASFEAMTRLGLTEALTADHHFEQAGFVRLLK